MDTIIRCIYCGAEMTTEIGDEECVLVTPCDCKPSRSAHPDHAAEVSRLEAERDSLRAQLEAARREAMDEGWQKDWKAHHGVFMWAVNRARNHATPASIIADEALSKLPPAPAHTEDCDRGHGFSRNCSCKEAPAPSASSQDDK